MAIYHLSTKPVSRAMGHSATAGIAYRTATRIHDFTTDQVFDYTRKRGVQHAEIVLPTKAAQADINWARDRQLLWNAAETAERRKDSRVAREYELALPHELTKEQRVELVRVFSAEIANRFGVAVDFAIHAAHRHGDGRNFHAHVFSTTREITATGLGAKTDIELGDRDRAQKGLGPGKLEIKAIRARWAELANEHLLAQGIEARIDHRTLKAQGIEREPTTHLGPAVWGQERRGIETEVGNRVRAQQRAEREQRLERSAELGQLEHEGQALERSILDLSGDLAARREARSHEGPEQGAGTRDDAPSRAQAAAERWKEQRAQHPPPSIEERQRQGREAWLKLRREREAGQESTSERAQGLEQEREQGQEKSAEQSKERGQEHDGPEIDFD